MATLNELDLFLAQGPEDTRDAQEYTQLVKIYDALKYIAKNFENATAADAGLDALAAFNTNGFLVQTSEDNFAGRTLTGTANEISISNPAGTAGNPVFSLPAALTFTGKTITGGNYDNVESLSFGSAVAASVTDLSRHIELYSPGYGFSITASQLNYNVNTGADHVFYVNGVLALRLDNALADFTGTIEAVSGNFGNTTVASDSIEINALGSGDRNSYIDFHAAGTGTDYNARILRNLGVNAQLQIIQTGTGDINISGGGNLTRAGSTIWHAGNDGAGSGLDADLLDGLNSLSFVRSDATTTLSTGIQTIFRPTAGQNMNTATGSLAPLEVKNDTGGADAFMSFHSSGDYAFYFGLDATTNDLAVGGWSMGAVKRKVWHAGNDGTGSGLDADLLDGLNSASAATASTIAARDASADIYCRYLNGNAAVESPTIGSVVVQNAAADGFLRKVSNDNFMRGMRGKYVILSGSLTGGASTTINVPSGAWKKIELVLHNLTFASDFIPFMRINSDTTAGNYRYAGTYTNTNTGASATSFGSTAATAMCLWSDVLIESTNSKFNSTVTIYDPSVSTIRKNIETKSPGCIFSGDGVVYSGGAAGGMWLGTAAVSTLTILFQNTAGKSPAGSGLTPSTGDYTLIGYL